MARQPKQQKVKTPTEMIDPCDKPKYRTDTRGTRYICVRRASNVWDVGLPTAREWIARGVSWKDVQRLTAGQLPLF